MKARPVQLTLCWFLLLWRGGPRFAVGPIRRHDQGVARTIGATLSVCRLTIGLARLGPTKGIRATRWWDFAGPVIGLWSVGWWRTEHPILFSTGLMRGGGRWPIGVTVTVAARTLCIVHLRSAADHKRLRAAARARKEQQ